jgi:phenylacetic acid degradation operon negative regulatory protein
VQPFVARATKGCIDNSGSLDYTSSVQPKTEEFLNLLLWSAELLARPTFRNLTDSYESWAYRQGLWRQVNTLEKRQLVERYSATPDERVCRLTEQGRLHALGGRDPQAQWLRPWDGCWRLVLFDVPRRQNTRRELLRRYLRSKSFGCLQGSVWITPDPLRDEREILATGRIDVESLVMLEGRPCANESDADIVAGAWDFERINLRYTRHLKVLEQRPARALRDQKTAQALRHWGAAEREAWLEAVSLDPLLPERLLPLGYLGQTAWRRRIAGLGEAGQQLQGFSS